MSAAISLKNAFEDIGRLYRLETGIIPRFNFGASGILQKQIESGAPVDVFASAGEKQMDALQELHLLLPETRRTFALNTLVLIVPGKTRSAIASFRDLAGPALGRLAVGNPKTVPAGYYAAQTLRSLKLWDTLQPRLIPAEDVRQVLEYVARGEADAGLVYSTDVAVAAGRVVAVERAPEHSHDPIRYPIAAVKDSQHSDAARLFIETVLSTEGQKILTRYGFLAVR